MPRRRGNPKIQQHGYTTDREKPLNFQISIKVDEDIFQALQELGDDKAEFCREAIKEALEKRRTQK